MKIEKSAGFVIYINQKNNLKFLLLKRSDKKQDYWEMPKGHVGENEDELESARRELFEETGVNNITICGSFKEKVSYISRKTGNKRIFTFFLATTKDKIKLSPEHSIYVFVDLDTAKSMLSHIDWYNVLKKASLFLNS